MYFFVAHNKKGRKNRPCFGQYGPLSSKVIWAYFLRFLKAWKATCAKGPGLRAWARLSEANEGSEGDKYVGEKLDREKTKKPQGETAA